MQHEQECCARVLQAAEHRRQAPAVRAKAIPDKANQRKAAALCHSLCLLLSESVAESKRQREPAAVWAVESEALALAEDCSRQEAVMRAEMSASSSLADE